MSYDTQFDAFIGLLGAFLSFFLGGLDSLMIVLLVVVGCDMVSGLIKAFILKSLSSDVGFHGIARKICMFMIVGIANVIDNQMLGHSEALRDGVIIFYLSSEGISIFENVIDMGVPVPEWLKERFLTWRNKQLVVKNKPDE